VGYGVQHGDGGTVVTDIEFRAWPKTARLFRDCVITEKLDGTNAAIGIRRMDLDEYPQGLPGVLVGYGADDTYMVYAQSRKRVITPEADNFGFARWVHSNASELVTILGEGLHFGEWWGVGIQRRYGQEGKNFSLFNTEKWAGLNKVLDSSRITVVPSLYEGPFSTAQVHWALARLRVSGSIAAPGFLDPEGVCVYHKASSTVYKATFEHDESGKDPK
jgi:RNA ligase